MFKKVLVANRGEIAVRVMRSLREMGIASVAVYSEADASAWHTACADEALCIGGAAPSESYLNIDAVLAAAKATGAEAIHPGYGFLAENPSFAGAVVEAGLVFIGPSAKVMASLGDKTEARLIMARGGVPIIPGMAETSADPKRLALEAEAIGYPVLLKAAAGGGGKGMRVVETPEALADATRAASSEAQAAFGDGRVYLEKYLTRPRHVEFQVLADTLGGAVHVFERECSIQRRHQKIIEEAPSPALDAGLRKRMGAAAVAAVRASGYVNAGTVEFLLDEDGDFYFLEVNTRLQVEHPITEMCTGLDLVRLQIQVAAGEPLGFTQRELVSRGHAIECRIYAEDPATGFMPSPGRVLVAETPSGPGVRYDSGVRSGDEVPVHYDPILGKLVVHAETRKAAIDRMIRALGDCVILGVQTPIGFLAEVLDSAPFRAGDTSTGFLDEHFAEWTPSIDGRHLAALGHELAKRAAPAATQAVSTDPRGYPNSPWKRLGAWRM